MPESRRLRRRRGASHHPVITMPLLLPLLSLTAFLSFTAGQTITDLTALYSLRASLSLRARDWPRGADPCSRWTGVGCDSAGRVISLNIQGLRRTHLGRLNPRFAVDGLQNLTFLSSFNASGFYLPGSIPAWIGRRNPRLSLLDLSHASISGEIPSSLADLSSLVSLDLSSNSLVGSLPDSLTKLKSLQNLNFGSNLLTGSVKGELFSSLSKLESVTLCRNNFSGLIQASIFSLPGLKFLDLSYNNFTGNLPNFSVLNFSHNGIEFDLSHNLFYGYVSSEFALLFSGFNSVDLSDNYLQGSVPVDGNNSIIFSSNCFQNASSQRSTSECEEFYRGRGIPYDPTVDSNGGLAPGSSLHSSKRKKTWINIVIGVVCGSVLVVFFVILNVWCIMRCGTHSAEQTEMNVISVASSTPAVGVEQPSQVSVKSPTTGETFTYEQLKIATLNFGEENLIKHGRSGDLYQGFLEDESLVVVKRIDMSIQTKEKYLVELDLFARTSHERLVTLLGHCLLNEAEKFLVYRQMPYGDLSNALYRTSVYEENGLQSLDWITRLKIATGVAEALCHLHYEFTPPLVHRDIQASSILLDDKFEVRLGSLSNVCAQEGEGYQRVISRFLRLSQTSDQNASGLPPALCTYDVYCFGKVLLELVTGKLGISGSNGSSTSEWLVHTLGFININEKELITNIIDPSLVICEDLVEEVWAMSIVARACLNPKPSKRPLMKYVLKAVENPLKVVREDSGSGSARLRDSSSRKSWNAAFFGSWHHSSREVASGSAPPRNGRSLRHSGTLRSQESVGEFSHSRSRPSKEIFPEPHDMED